MIKEKLISGLTPYRKIFLGSSLLFCLGSFIYALSLSHSDDILLSLATVMLVCLPTFLGCLLHFEMNTAVFTFLGLYAFGPLLGSLYNLYYITSWWDDLLHFCGGIVFAAFGYFLFGKLNENREHSLLAVTAFAVCFSISVSVLWEFVEFSSDCLFHTDMQMDTVVTELHSYYLDDEYGVRGSITDISDTWINGRSLAIKGYLDLGLIDTMRDMILETIAAILFGAAVLIDKGKYPLFMNTDR